VLTASIFPVLLLLATLLCSLVAGFVLLFAIVVMPGIGTLPNREFLQAFQVIDKVIQNNQPLFIFIWIGSAVALLVAAALGIWQPEGVSRILIIVATFVLIAGVQVPTLSINIPLNNRVQTLNLDTLDEESLANERLHFEHRWNRWNIIRTAFACVASVLLLLVVRLI
jgi:uncharacterized membrane protein